MQNVSVSNYWLIEVFFTLMLQLVNTILITLQTAE